MIKKIKQWLGAYFYPEPHKFDGLDNWKAFAQKASYERVDKVMNQKYVEWQPWFRVEERQILEVLLKRVAQMPWPKLSREFCKKNAQRIFVVESLATAKQEVSEKFGCCLPKILVDANRQCLGIVVSSNLVISAIVTKMYHSDIAVRMRWHNMINNRDAGLMDKKADYINELYQLMHPKRDLYNARYWVNASDRLALWQYPGKIDYLGIADEGYANLMFKL